MSDVENYSILFPENVSSIKIINQTNNIIVVEEKIRSGYIDFSSGPIGFTFGSLERTNSDDEYSGISNSKNSVSSGFTSEDLEMNLLVKHEIIAPDSHTIEILNGEAKGTKISITYHDIDEGTEIETYVQIQSSGFFRIFLGYMDFENFESVTNSIISTFEKSS